MIGRSQAGAALRRIAQDLTAEAELSGGEVSLAAGECRALIDALTGAAEALDGAAADWEADHA